ncbi:hypothetical protein SSS_06943 [Sarcoptes scabiei]|uniref:Uncharacterized protein n=1 Tax=Sarcoptes scabiei TaxID=52283 RepID=A0A834R9I1_SARSC|nr:hypothetical protein SSS_06943 [Sarcoptes scabiei]
MKIHPANIADNCDEISRYHHHHDNHFWLDPTDVSLDDPDICNSKRRNVDEYFTEIEAQKAKKFSQISNQNWNAGIVAICHNDILNHKGSKSWTNTILEA